jgi:hypothetical protein
MKCIGEQSMSRLREGLEYPIIPEDLVATDDELSPELFEYLLFMCAICEMQDKTGIEEPVASGC